MYLNATLLAQIWVFIILALFTMKFVWPPIVKALDERAARISEGLAEAERGRQSLALSAKHATETMREGKEKAAEVIAQAEKRAEQIIEKAKADARLEAEKVVAAAKAEIEQEETRMRESLRGRVADLAIAGAEKILRREVDAKAHAGMLASIGQDL
ncbi:MAG: F0F1 ATP synthase subunit B [Candidatus Accumulibacter sp.]|nr:F0F1 ATP synthase subunit B [Accumulibacter sp.]